MDDTRQINKILCYFPTIPLVCWAVMVLLGLLKFGRLPIYGLDPDPFSLSIDWLDYFAFIYALICFLTIPATILLTLSLVFNKQNLLRQAKIALLISFISVSTIVISKYFLPSTFLWIMD